VRTLIATRLSRLAEGLPGDIAPVGNGISELRIHYGPGYRVYLQQRGTILVILLCGGNKSTQARDIVLQRNSHKSGRSDMVEKLTTYDPAAALVDSDEIAFFMADALETGNAAYIAKALGVVARAKGMAQIANETGLSREQLYRSFSENGNPTLKTTLAVMKALGIDLTAKVHA